VRILAESEVADLVDLPGAIACFRQLFAEQAAGDIATWPPAHFTSHGANLLTRAAALAGQARVGATVSSGAASSRFALLYDIPDGRPLALLGYPFSDVRLNAAVGLGIDLLARRDASRVAMLGSGQRALGLLEAACAVREIASVEVYSPTPEHRARFAQEAQQTLGVPVRAADAPQPIVVAADITITMTNARQPALFADWLPADGLVVSAGQRNELEEAVFLDAALIVTTSREHELTGPNASDNWPLLRMTRSGALAEEMIVELGEIVTGQRARPDGRVVFHEAQGGFTDIALAAFAYERAVALGRGFEWDQT
jgi:alanine dehydrogenase